MKEELKNMSEESLKNLEEIVESELLTVEDIRERLEFTEKGKTRQTIQNCKYVLENDPCLKGVICRNEMTCQIDIRKEVPWKRRGLHMTDTDMNNLSLYLEQNYGLTSDRVITKAVDIVANENSFHPIIEYLETLVWDGEPRVKKMLSHFFGVEDEAYAGELMQMHMMAAIKRLYEPGTKYDIMLCLVGGQGTGKSTFFRFLAIEDDYFTDDMKRIDDKKAYEYLQGHWIVEMSEMNAVANAKSIEETKAFLEYNRNHEVMNIMLIEEPEAHIHAHIQKTLFDKLQISTEYTQVVMTTHSAQLSEIAEIKKVNVMKIDGLHSVVMQPCNGLDEFGEKELKLNKIKLSKRLEKYLDAKRSVLLFSKGVILVEGDAEEIMLPSMVKKTLGVSLDELGIGVINIGSVSFEYVASIFAEERLRRRCAIVTDLDAILENAEKCKKEAADRGKSRKEKLERLFGNNKYVQMFYANYTFEVDFTNIEKNRFYYKQVIEENYQKEDTIKKHKDCIDESEAKRYDTVISVANYIGKGWLAMSLADDLDYNVVIPDYLLRAVAFSGGKSISDAVLWKMLKYTVKCNEEGDISDIKDGIQCSNSLMEQNKILKLFCTKFPETMLSKLVKYMEENGDR